MSNQEVTIHHGGVALKRRPPPHLLLLDLDGTVRRCKSDPNGFINSPLDQEIIPEAAEALRHYADMGWRIVGCSNQGGVAAGYKSLQDCREEQAQTMRLAPEINEIFFCPDDGRTCEAAFFVGKDDARFPLAARKQIGDTFQFFSFRADEFPRRDMGPHWANLHIRSFRKPKCGMLLLAMHECHAQPGDCLFVGDRDEDREAALSAGVTFFWEKMWWESRVEPIAENA